MGKRLDEALRGLRAAMDGGRRAEAAAYARLVRQTMPDWDRLAHYLLGRWEVPPCVGAEDLVQEMLAEAWEAVRVWDPARGMDLPQYAVWRALSRARVAIDRARGAGKHKGKARSRHPVCFTVLGTATTPDPGSVQPGQEAAVRLRELAAGLDPVRRAVLVELLRAGGGVDEAARAVVADWELRMLTGAENVAAARRACREVLELLRAAA